MFTFYLTFYNIYLLERLFSESNCAHIVMYNSGCCLQFDHKQIVKVITTVSSSGLCGILYDNCKTAFIIFHLYVSFFFHPHFKELIRSDYYKWRVGSCHDCFYSRRTNVLKINECGGSFDHIDRLKHISTIENLEVKERFNLGWGGSRVRIHHSSVYTNYSIHKHNY